MVSVPIVPPTAVPVTGPSVSIERGVGASVDVGSGVDVGAGVGVAMSADDGANAIWDGGVADAEAGDTGGDSINNTEKTTSILSKRNILRIFVLLSN